MYEGDAHAEVDMNVVMTGSGDFVEIQATAEGRPFTGGEMQDLLALAAAGIRRLSEAQRTILRRSFWRVGAKPSSPDANALSNKALSGIFESREAQGVLCHRGG